MGSREQKLPKMQLRSYSPMIIFPQSWRQFQPGAASLPTLKLCQFLLSGNMAGILSVLTLRSSACPYLSHRCTSYLSIYYRHLPAIAIGLEPHNKNLMREKPRNVNEPILNKTFAAAMFIEGVNRHQHHDGISSGAWHLGCLSGSTMAFATSLSRLIHGFNHAPKNLFSKSVSFPIFFSGQLF